MTVPRTADRFREIQALEPADHTPQEIGTAILDLTREIHRQNHGLKLAQRSHLATLAGTCVMLGLPKGTAEPDMFEAIRRLRAALAEEESVCRERGHWLAEVDAALTAAGQDEGGGYIAYARRITEVATERDRLSAELEQARAEGRAQVIAELRTRATGPMLHRVLDEVAEMFPAPACTCGARPVHQNGCDTDQDN